jgi:ubiquitin-protein ligase
MSSAANKRIMRDIAHVTGPSKETLERTGIYFQSDETDIYHGTAMLVGQKDTPYYGGYYFFDIRFPADYPFAPIKVKTLTQDGKTRFNPNMYLEGKVCLSILNTWHDGPQWSSVQTLESVLLVMMADVLNAIPLTNEPAYYNAGLNEQAKIYNRMLFHANVKTAILTMLNAPPPFALPFLDTMRAVFLTNYADVLLATETHEVEWDGRSEMLAVYGMTVRYDFTRLAGDLRAAKMTLGGAESAGE